MAATITLTPSTVTIRANNNYSANISFSITGDTKKADRTLVFYLRNGELVGSEIGRVSYITNASGSATGTFHLKLTEAELTARFANSATAVLTCTILQNTSVVSNAVSVELKAPPVIQSCSVVSNWQADNSVYIAGMTSAIGTAIVEGQFGATIASVQFVFVNLANPYTNATESDGVWSVTRSMNASTSVRIELVVTDSRGEITRQNITYIDVKAHTEPTITAEVFRCDENGDKDYGGGYLSVTAWATPNPAELGMLNDTINYILGQGSLSPEIEHGEISIGTPTVIGNGSISPDLDYILEIYAADNASAHGAQSLTGRIDITVPIVKRAINIKDGGTGVAFGKLSQTDSLLDSAWDIHTDGTVTADTPIAIASGGTGAATASSARTNLGVSQTVRFALAANGSVSLNFGTYTHALVVVSGYSDNIKSVYLITAAVSTISVKAITTSSYVSYTTSGTNMQISNSSTIAGAVFAIILGGSIED